MYNPNELIEEITQFNDQALKIEGYDHCIMGMVEIAGANPVILYDYEKIIDTLAQEMTEQEASEFFEFNILGSYMGNGSPAFYYKLHSTAV